MNHHFDHATSNISYSHFPTLAISLRQQLVGRFIVRELKRLGIPVERLAGAMGHVPKEVVFDQTSRVIEVTK